MEDSNEEEDLKVTPNKQITPIDEIKEVNINSEKESPEVIPLDKIEKISSQNDERDSPSIQRHQDKSKETVNSFPEP